MMAWLDDNNCALCNGKLLHDDKKRTIDQNRCEEEAD